MDALQRLFGPLTKDLAPGVRDPGRIVRDRILYRSAGEKSAAKPKAANGEAMTVEHHDAAMPDAEIKQAGLNKRQEMFRIPGFSKEDMAVDVAPEKSPNRQDTQNNKDKDDEHGDGLVDLMSMDF